MPFAARDTAPTVRAGIALRPSPCLSAPSAMGLRGTCPEMSESRGAGRAGREGANSGLRHDPEGADDA